MPKQTLDEYERERRERASEAVRPARCDRCGARVLTARVGRTAALDVIVDPAPVGLPQVAEARCQSRRAWLHRAGHPWLADRLVWLSHSPMREAPYWTRPHWGLVLDHRCLSEAAEQEGERDEMDDTDPFGLDGPDRDEVKRDHHGRYLMDHPATGREEAWQRVTTFAKITTDQYNLQAWRMRNVAVGLAQREDLLHLAATMDVSEDKKRLNEVCESAEVAAGSKSGANRGTALHSATEVYDRTGDMDRVPKLHRARVEQYAEAIEQAGITMIPELIERRIVHTGYQVGGTFDRIGELSPELLRRLSADPAGGDRAVVDLKTGKTLDYGWAEHAVQQVMYVDGFNANGVWDPVARCWEVTHGQVRTDFALIIHMPAIYPDKGVMIYRIDLDEGRRGAELCAKVRAYRKTTPKVMLLDLDTPLPDAPATPDSLDWAELVVAATDMPQLIVLRDRAKAAGVWGTWLGALCKARAKELT